MMSEKLLLAFEGVEVPDYIAEWLGREPLGGFTLFRGLNVENVAQVRALTAHLQRIAWDAGHPSLLIATDQECGQFMALGDEMTPFAGNWALGVIDDVDLTARVGRAVGRELAAVGVNLNYGPMADINTEANNPAAGIRTFGDRPELVARHTAAYVAGLQSAGVAATLKHFPGLGDLSVDTHHELPQVGHSRERLDEVELVPFRAGIDAGSKLVMSAHMAIPAITGRTDLPATLSKAVMHDLVRGELGFEGVIVTDAFDMKAISQGAGQMIEAIAAFRAQVDLLLLTKDRGTQERLAAGLKLALSRGLLSAQESAASLQRITHLKEWAASISQPDLSIINGEEHRALAREVAERSITLVKNEVGLLPLSLDSDAEVVAIMPQPVDLTPADTSSFVLPQLGAALGGYHSRVREIVVSHYPDANEIEAVRLAVETAEVVVIGTLSASMNEAQTALVQAVLAVGRPTVTVALRTPYDLAAYPQSQTHLRSYGILRPSLDALAGVIFGRVEPHLVDSG